MGAIEIMLFLLKKSILTENKRSYWKKSVLTGKKRLVADRDFKHNCYTYFNSEKLTVLLQVLFLKSKYMKLIYLQKLLFLPQ